VEDFDTELLQVIDETISYCLGEINKQVIFKFIEKRGVSKQEIPKKLDVFAEALEDIIGRGRGQILGAAIILENAILEQLCKKLNVNYDKLGLGQFSEKCGRLKKLVAVEPVIVGSCRAKDSR
jgi:hypothetical protein